MRGGQRSGDDGREGTGRGVYLVLLGVALTHIQVTRLVSIHVFYLAGPIGQKKNSL